MMAIKVVLVGTLVILLLAVTKLLLPVVKLTINVLRRLCLHIIALDTTTRTLTARLNQKIKVSGRHTLEFVRLCNANIKKLDIPNKANNIIKDCKEKVGKYYSSLTAYMATYSRLRTEKKELKPKEKKRITSEPKDTEPNLFNCKEDFYNYRKQLNEDKDKKIICAVTEELDKTVLIDVKTITELATTNDKNCSVNCNNCNYMKNPHCPNCISCMLEREGYCSLSKQCSFNLRKECANYYSNECELRKSLLFPD